MLIILISEMENLQCIGILYCVTVYDHIALIIGSYTIMLFLI